MAIDSTVAEPEAGAGDPSPPATAALSSTSSSSSLPPGAVRPPARPPSGEKARRIVEAMRTSVARRGTVGSTFDRVSREAGVSRGLLHYYFGTKERLLLEAVRHDCQLRMEILQRQVSGARSAEDFIGLMAQNLREAVSEDPDLVTLLFELFTLSRRNEDIAAEYAELMRATRRQVAAMLAAGQRDGILSLRAEPEAVAEALFSLADGLALRMLAEPDRDFEPTVQAGIACARALLSA